MKIISNFSTCLNSHFEHKNLKIHAKFSREFFFDNLLRQASKRDRDRRDEPREIGIGTG
jgi:hypothetical protein